MSDSNRPIENLDRFDVVGVRKDGGIDVVLSCSGPLDDSAETLWLLWQKVRNYLGEISSETFRTTYGAGLVRILISCEHDVSSPAQALIASLKDEAASQGVGLQLSRQVA
ncbi:hypothetical protein ASD14_04485 [Lysobacter sp. Root494]|jgi:hypothetical protein|nr:hypothetical protein ASD14_04485 [Lysobacter sp. Root494]